MKCRLQSIVRKKWNILAKVGKLSLFSYLLDPIRFDWKKNEPTIFVKSLGKCKTNLISFDTLRSTASISGSPVASVIGGYWARASLPIALATVGLEAKFFYGDEKEATRLFGNFPGE